MTDRTQDVATPSRNSLCTPSRLSTPNVVESLEDRRLLAANPVGMVVADNSAANVDSNTAVMKAMGVTTIRLWATVQDWKEDRYLTNSMKRAIDYANKGFDVMLVVHTYQGRIPDPADVKDWFQWATGNKALRNAVDRWEIGNEVDQDYYWQGNLKQYVTNFLKPASEALHDVGEKVVSAGVSWNPEDVRRLIDYGMLGYADYVGYHPYANSISVQARRIREVNQIVAGRKPIVATEWNVYEGTKSETTWAEAVGRAYPQIEANFEMAYYFNLTSGHPSLAGGAGTITPTGKKTPFFYAIQTAVNDGVKVPAPKPTPTPTPTKPRVPTASKPPVVSKPAPPPPPPDPAIRSFALYNADTDRVIPGYAAVLSGATINLARVGTRNLAIVANTVGSKSVLFNVNGQIGFDATVPFASFGDRGSNLLGMKMTPGAYTVYATAYENGDASGKTASKSIQFNVRDSGGSSIPVSVRGKPLITGLQLQDARTGLAIPGFENLTSAAAIRLSKLPTRAIRVVALTNGGAGSVELHAFGKTEILDARPFQSGSVYAIRGKYYLQATAYAADGGSGAEGNTLGLTVRFI